MSNPPPNNEFIIAFTQSLKNLQNIDGVLQKTTDNRAQFLGMVTSGLNDIKERIISLATLISAMKNNLEKLQQQLDSNTSDITTNNRERDQLQQQIKKLTADKTKLQEDLKATEEQMLQQTAITQAVIDGKESQIIELQNEKKTLQDQAAALNKQLADKGTEGQASAKQIADLTKQNQQALAKQQEDFERQISQLQKQIQEKEKELLDSSNQMKQTIEALGTQLREAQIENIRLESLINNNDRSTKEITDQNNLLIEKIKQATAIINDTVQKMNQLTNDVQNAQDIQSIKKIFEEVNQEITKIETLLKGSSNRPSGQNIPRPTRTPPPPPSGQNRNSQTLPDNTLITYDGTQQTFKWIKDELTRKARQFAFSARGGNDNKYVRTIELINRATSAEEVAQILGNQNIKIKNNQIMGGNRTNKNHKGGFIYTKKYRRSSNSSKSSKSSKSSSGKHSRRRRGRGHKHSHKK